MLTVRTRLLDILASPRGGLRLPTWLKCKGHLSQTDRFSPLSCSPFQAAGAEIPCLSNKQFSVAAVGQGRKHDHETTVGHALMRGLVTAGPVMRRGASSV